MPRTSSREAVESLEDSVELTVVEELARLSHRRDRSQALPRGIAGYGSSSREQPELAEGPCHGDV